MSFLIGLKAKLVAIGLAVLAFVGVVLRNRYLATKVDKSERRADRAEATIVYKEKVEKSDAQITAEVSEVRKRIKEDVKAGKVPSNLSNPNDF